jgi:hypothetical protein
MIHCSLHIIIRRIKPRNIVSRSPARSPKFHGSQEDKLEEERRVENAGDASSKDTPAKITPLAPVDDIKVAHISFAA